MKLTTQQINQIHRLHKDGMANREIARQFGVDESTIRYQLGKFKKADKERSRSEVTNLLKKSVLESGLSKVLGKLDTALDHCGNDNDDVKLTIDIGRFYSSTLRLLDIAGEEDDELPETLDFKIWSDTIAAMPPELHKIALEIREKAIEEHKRKEKGIDEGGLIK